MAVDSSRMGAGSLQLLAPLSGPLVALEAVPDPVFAQKMVGDGISIDPTDHILRAPCAGEVIQLHRAHHALTLLADNNLEIMMHIGIDTVALAGVGFQPKVGVGDKVKVGDALIEFDADFVATKAKSLLTQIIITNGDAVASIQKEAGVVRTGKDIILTLQARSDSKNSDSSASLTADAEVIESAPMKIGNPTGLHARPAAMLVAVAKKYQAKIRLCKGQSRVNAKSLISIMGLEVGFGDSVYLQASGADAKQSIDELVEAITGGLGEDCSAIMTGVDETHSVSLEDTDVDELDSSLDGITQLQGVIASPGLAVGFVKQMLDVELDVPELGAGEANENQLLHNALERAHAQLDELQNNIQDKEHAVIFVAHQELLVDPALLDSCRELITEGKSAAFAWQQAYKTQAHQISKLNNELLAARANDLRDVGRRVLRLLLGLADETCELVDNTILIAEDLTPSDTANIDRNKVVGFCTVTGGASSHVAILARSLNLPAIAGIDRRALQLDNGAKVILDASHGSLRLNPSDNDVEQLQKAKITLEEKRKTDLANAHTKAITLCGHRLEVVGNIGTVADAKNCLAFGGEGSGLCRSEFLFMNRASAPSEDEQVAMYVDMAKSFKKGQPLIIRTLDVGGDKPLSYLPIAEEENPFLGLRGIRVSLQKPNIFRVQLRAILRAATAVKDDAAKIMVMFPMVTTMVDLLSAKAILEEERQALDVAAIPVGIMVEVPTVAVMAEQFAKEVDFFSVGTNDLTQYTLAMDRGHPVLAAQADGLNPGVLGLIANTVIGANKHNAWVGVCGGIASDAIATPILLGLGVHELSVSVPSIPEIKAAVRLCDMQRCQELAQKALQQNTADDVRELVAQTYPQLV